MKKVDDRPMVELEVLLPGPDCWDWRQVIQIETNDFDSRRAVLIGSVTEGCRCEAMRLFLSP